MTFTYDEQNVEQRALIQHVEYRLDDVTPDGQTPAINREAVYREMVASARTVLQLAPRKLVYEAALDGQAAPVRVESTYLHVTPPADFLRFLRIQVRGWVRPVTAVLMDDEADYARLRNPYTAPDFYHPAVVLAADPTQPSGCALECYPGPSEAASGNPSELEVFAYVGETAPEHMPYALRDAMLWHTVARLLQITGRVDAAGLAHDAYLGTLDAAQTQRAA